MRKYGRLVKAASGGFYRSRIVTCRNTPDMFFKANAEEEKKQSAFSQIISAFLLRKYAWSINAAEIVKNNNYFNSKMSYDFHILHWIIFYTWRSQEKTTTTKKKLHFRRNLWFPHFVFSILSVRNGKYTKNCVYCKKRTLILIPRQIMISMSCIYCIF